MSAVISLPPVAVNPAAPRRLVDCIGHSPVVRLQHLVPPGIQLSVKLESFNPGGSIKDRLALAIIEDAERRGLLRRGQTVIEASSGNTGIALAMVCAARGYPLVIVMAENFSVERRRLMRLLGAKVVLTPAALKGSGMVAKARELAAEHGWFYCDQFNNPANTAVHARTTAQEILASYAGRRLDAVVLGAGTGGTLEGVARVLKRERPDCAMVLCEPATAPLVGSGMGQPRHADGRVAGSHPAFRPHPMQGWSPDFLSAPVEAACAAGHIDRVLSVTGDAAIACARELARREGILCGISAGATVSGALQLCQQLPRGSEVLCILADSAERYLSTALFDGIEADMDAAEWAISRSTAGARFDAPEPSPITAKATVKRAAVLEAPDPEAIGQLLRWQNDPAAPVVVFGLTECEFSHALCRMLDELGVGYRLLNFDALALAEHRLGERMRACLHGMNGSTTLPQLFVGGHWIGGATDACRAWQSGALPRRLRALGVSFDADADFDPSRLLPRWVQSRPTANLTANANAA